jgi:very-short-patch-repair endonuclease
MPEPELQQNIYDEDGQFVARVDFCWQEQRTIGEFDGKIKYGRMLKPGQSLEDVLFAEKRREDALRDLGWQIVRWLWADLYRRGVIRDRVLRAFARSM